MFNLIKYDCYKKSNLAFLACLLIFLQRNLKTGTRETSWYKFSVGMWVGILCMVAGACDSGAPGTTYEAGKVKYITSFPQRINLKGREIELAPLSYGCAWIRGVVDTTVILVDADGTNGYFHAYSTHRNKYAGSFATRGRGPGEYAVAPNLVDPGIPGTVGLADVYTGKTVFKNLDSLIKFGKSADVYKSPSPVVKGGINALEYMNDSVRILRRLYFIRGDKITVSYSVLKDTVQMREIKVFDFSDSDRAADLNALAISTAVSPNGEKIFCALCHFNQINVYSLSGEKDFTICVSKERRLYSQEELDNTGRITRRYFYDGAVCSENYLFALYYNLPAIKHETEQNVFPVIQVFTFNGEPVAELAVRERLSDIAFDRVHNRIYGFTRDGRLLHYDLRGVGLS